jgi:3-oxoacyl-[acyl-carrier protein] reductase
MNQYDLEGRVAIVTGAARGIGRAVAQRLLASGATVVIWDKDGEAGEETRAALARDGTVMASALDLTDNGAVEAAVAQVLETFGRIDILVNNAGIAGPTLALWDYPVDDWRHVIETDLISVFLCCRAVAPVMKAQGAGRIVNVASVAGKEGNPNASAYSAAKAGVIALTKSLGKELARSGVLVNCITPATVKTDIFSQMSEEHIQYMLSKIPMGRFGTVEENAHIIAWLCSPDCSFSTGAVFDTSGGRCTY